MIIEKQVGVTAMVGGSENEYKMLIPTQVTNNPPITGNI